MNHKSKVQNRSGAKAICQLVSSNLAETNKKLYLKGMKAIAENVKFDKEVRECAYLIYCRSTGRPNAPLHTVLQKTTVEAYLGYECK